MWNLSGDDVKRAIEELRGRRAEIQARYEGELKKLEADLAELENFERFALKIASDYLGDTGPSAPGADPSSPPEEGTIITVSERTGSTNPQKPVEQSAEPEPAADSEPAGGAKGSSRWRMRLGTGETSR
jgi:hypothetical protein